MSEAKKRRNRNTNKELRSNILLLILPLGAFILSLTVTTALSVIFDVQKSLNFPVAEALFAVCSFIDGFVSGKIKRKNGIVTGIVYNLPSAFLIIVLSLILNKFKADYNLLISVLLALAASAAGGITGVNSKKKIRKGIR